MEQREIAHGVAQYTLTSGTDYTHVGPGHPVDCPNGCKDLYALTNPISVPGRITSIRVVQRIPPSNNHWSRCEREVPCGVAEFSDVADHTKSCIGSSAFGVWRATNGMTSSEQDVIEVTWE